VWFFKIDGRNPANAGREGINSSDGVSDVVNLLKPPDYMITNKSDIQQL
jgi:hypothetical protein